MEVELEKMPWDREMLHMIAGEKRTNCYWTPNGGIAVGRRNKLVHSLEWVTYVQLVVEMLDMQGRKLKSLVHNH